jgi:SAM-dependent methyltransferase
MEELGVRKLARARGVVTDSSLTVTRRAVDAVHRQVRAVIARFVPYPPPLKQGVHPDPLDGQASPPPHASWSAAQRTAYASADMELFRDCLRLPGIPDVRAAVLDDLSTYSGLSPEACVERCRNWEAWSVDEWGAADRTTAGGISAFYRTVQSWAFDLLWYAYLQAEGWAYPTSVLALRLMDRKGHGRSHLDFGSGVGITSQLFARRGYEIDLADLSTPLLAFARHRLERRGERARFIDLNETRLETARYDVITALDTLGLVPDFAATASELHRALRPGGWLIANYSPRPPSDENAWHLYEDDLDLRYAIQQVGFKPSGRFGEFIAYRRVDPFGLQRLRVSRDGLVLTSTPRRVLHRQNLRLARLIRGIPDPDHRPPAAQPAERAGSPWLHGWGRAPGPPRWSRTWRQ